MGGRSRVCLLELQNLRAILESQLVARRKLMRNVSLPRSDLRIDQTRARLGRRSIAVPVESEIPAQAECRVRAELIRILCLRHARGTPEVWKKNRLVRSND